IQGDLRKNGEFINNQGGALLHHNSPIPWSTFAQYLTMYVMHRYHLLFGFKNQFLIRLKLVND
ncbi:hypothetical protein, partial [Yersinia enterocolitica]|uniref:hypothetical protein n=1 Tax=Yersinia enterocolitica TaxID=630 RepID=UPI001E541941